MDTKNNRRLPANGQGKVISVADGVLWISGLENVGYGETVELPKQLTGLCMSLEQDKVGVIALGDSKHVKSADKTTATGELLQIAVGEELLGRAIDPLGNPIDYKGDIKTKQSNPIEIVAPGILERSSINTPLQTGIKAIDAVIPIGRGQRELIIGDRGTGKTAIAIDTIINQKDTDVICIYVAIGQKKSKVAEVVDRMEEHEVLDKTIIVNASASDPASMLFIAPYAAVTIAEHFASKGKHVLVVYDDLTKHAWAYREISLLLRRPSGREAYPGDIFYLHSRLLERACQLSEPKGRGSITALPIIETQSGDVSAYIPTNVISITDGQIYLESDLFFAGTRPAINIGLSVSRIGGAAQVAPMKKVAGRLRLDLSQYYELATFAQFATDLDQATKEKIERGKRIVELLKQPQYSPSPVEQEIISVYLATSGALDQIELDLIGQFEAHFLKYLTQNAPDIIKKLAQGEIIEGKLEEKLNKLAQAEIKKYI